MKTKKNKDLIEDPEYGLDSRFKSIIELSEEHYKNVSEVIRADLRLLED